MNTIYGTKLVCYRRLPLHAWLLSDLTLSQTTILDPSNLKEFADDNSKFDENGSKFSKQVENTVETGEIAHDEQFLLIPVFSRLL